MRRRLRLPGLIAALVSPLVVPLVVPLAAAQAQVGMPPETVLHIAETGEVTRAPDELRATLRAEARGGSAAAAQEAVNRAVAAALARAGAVPGVQATTGRYWTQRLEEPRAWQAVQAITLRGADPAPLLELAGALQASGLALSGLDWTLTREAGAAARAEAERLAIEGLRRRAEAVAAQLGMRLEGIRELRLEAPDRPSPRAFAMAARAAASPATPPAAVPEEQVVTAMVSAQLVLRPR